MEHVKKKILFTVINDLSYDQRMIRICTSLANAGYDVTLVGRALPDSIALEQKPFQQKRLNCFAKKGKVFYLEYNLRLFFFLLFNNVDIISSVDLDTLVACTFVAKIKSKKLVFDSHEYFPEVPEVTNRPVTKKIWTGVAKLFIPHVDKAYTVGAELANEFEKLYKKPVDVIMNAPVLIERQEQASAKPYILYQGDLNAGRGLEQLIAAIKNLDILVKIAGNGPLKEKLMAQVESLGLQNKVEFLGYLKTEPLAKVTNEAWLGVNVLENTGLSYYYSLANKFFNYIHAGIPQLCADFPEYRNINAQAEVAVLVDCNSQHIMTAIEDLRNNPAKYSTLKENTKKARNMYNWQTEEKKLLHLYQSL